MLKFNPIVEERVDRQHIVLNGEVVGEVWKTKHGFQCQLITATLRRAPGSMSMNGIGDTPEEAITNALTKGREQSETLLSEMWRITHELSHDKN